ncbi:BMP-2-inducible protein kinase [Paraconiothyrium brasiliense]|uniref:BMP-2-inducible protein kinase n=1 Tax=Paraconiothyrium brasiliense TaxID=300254 RepID=A0ABR3QKE4_9PLEO
MDIRNPNPPVASNEKGLVTDKIEKPKPPLYSDLMQSGDSLGVWVDTSSEETYDDESLRQDLEEMDIQWSPALQDIQKNIKPLVSAKGIPPFYLGVSSAGRGAHGTVVFCLPRPVAIAAKYSYMQGSPRTIAELKAQLVAVKVATNGRHFLRQARNEALTNEMLLEILKDRDVDTVPRFISLLGRSSAGDSGHIIDSDRATYWLAFDAVFPSMTVGHLWGAHLQKFSDVAEWLMLRVFCDVMEALQFLHSCNPPIVHNDFHMQNVMFYQSDGLPRVLLMDFGAAEALAADKAQDRIFEDEFRSVCHSMYKLYSQIIETEQDGHTVPKGWDKFRDTIIVEDDLETTFFEDDHTVYGRLLKLAEPIAQSALANVDRKSVADIAKRLKEATEPEEAALLGKFQSMGLLPFS